MEIEPRPAEEQEMKSGFPIQSQKIEMENCEERKEYIIIGSNGGPYACFSVGDVSKSPNNQTWQKDYFRDRGSRNIRQKYNQEGID